MILRNKGHVPQAYITTHHVTNKENKHLKHHMPQHMIKHVIHHETKYALDTQTPLINKWQTMGRANRSTNHHMTRR